MKNKLLFAVVSIGMVTGFCQSTTLAQSGGPFNLSWNTCDAGGGSCSGGKLRLSAAAGQPDAGTCLGGTYQLGGGFLPAAQKTVGPDLKITRSFGAVILTWPAGPCTGFHLEASASVNGPWMDFGEGSPSGSERFVAVGSSAPHNFFRLRKACAGGCPQACRE